MKTEDILSLANPDKGAKMLSLESKYPGAMQSVTNILKSLGEDVTRQGIIDTPYRVVKSFLEFYGGYDMDDKEILSTSFQEENISYDEMVICKDISFFSTCEHHMVPFHGKCHIGYLPYGGVVGLSKLARLTECFSRRLQIQERLCNQIANSIEKHLNAVGVGVIIEAQHLCMCARGARNHSSVMVTSALRGKFKTQIETRNEFLNLIKK